MDRVSAGKFGEELVAGILMRNGFDIVGRNIHTRHGELDIVVRKKRALHIIEVKTRKSRVYGFEEEAVTRSKIQKIVLCVYAAQAKGLIPGGVWSIDVATVYLGDPEHIEVRWIWNVGLDR